VRLRLRMHRPQQSLRLLTRKGGRDHSALDHRPLPHITFGGTSSGRALCPRAEGSAGSDGCKPTAYRDAFQQNLYHTWKQMSRQTLVIRRGPGSPAVTQGAKPNGRS
jgi:hypothetical protein